MVPWHLNQKSSRKYITFINIGRRERGPKAPIRAWRAMGARRAPQPSAVARMRGAIGPPKLLVLKIKIIFKNSNIPQIENSYIQFVVLSLNITKVYYYSIPSFSTKKNVMTHIPKIWICLMGPYTFSHLTSLYTWKLKNCKCYISVVFLLKELDIHLPNYLLHMYKLLMSNNNNIVI